MASDEELVQITFHTKQQIYSVSDTPLSVPGRIDTESLNELLNQILKDSNPSYAGPVNFDFLIADELLRVTLRQHLLDRGASIEGTVEVEYIERTQAPEPQDSIQHDDWVCAVHTTDKWILSGSYDFTVNLWTIRGKLAASQKVHKGFVKDVAWLNQEDPAAGLVSVSDDVTALLWEWEPTSQTLLHRIALRGHTGGIESVGVSPNSQRVVTGGCDTNVKIWSTSFDLNDSETTQKKAKGVSKGLGVRTPLVTLSGHKAAILGIDWIDNDTIYSVSMDHSIILWDAELCGLKNTIQTQKAILAGSWSPLHKAIITASTDKHVRLYDPRSTEGSICKATFTGHSQWVSSVCWSKYDPNLFISGSYDACVKLWDTRSPKAALYDMQGHKDKVLAVDWSCNKYFVSGGADNLLNIFKNNDKTQ